MQAAYARGRRCVNLLEKALERICYMLPLPGIQTPGVGGLKALQVCHFGTLSLEATLRLVGGL